MAEFAIRDGHTTDLEPMWALQSEAMDFHAAREPHLRRSEGARESWLHIVTELLESPDGLVLVAELGGAIVGHLLASVRAKPPTLAAPPCGHIFDLAVSALHRRRGIGEALVAETTRRFAARGLPRIETSVAVTNEVSAAFWRSLGYGDFMRLLYRDIRARPEDLGLEEPSEHRAQAFLAMARETQAAGEGRYGPALRQDFTTYLARVRAYARGEGLPEGRVPTTTYWGVDPTGRIVGTVHLRHELTPELAIEGGHVGYAIRPADRRKGYATRLLALALERARDRGLAEVLVTCDDDNIGSLRAIEHNGGVLQGKGTSPVTGKVVRRYWVPTTPPPSGWKKGGLGSPGTHDRRRS